MENQAAISILDHQHHRVNINAVENIINNQANKRLSHTPSFWEDKANPYHAILPVIDLHQRSNPAARKDANDDQVVITSMKGAEVSMVVDGLFEVMTIHDSDTETTPHLMITIDSDFISGIARLNGQMVIRLDLAALGLPDKKH
jgi:purine-binding chemotaxis protein CheW